MLKQDIEIGETYLFVGSESPKRKHLAGQPFRVVSIQITNERIKFGRMIQVKTEFINEDGIRARAEELEPID